MGLRNYELHKLCLELEGQFPFTRADGSKDYGAYVTVSASGEMAAHYTDELSGEIKHKVVVLGD